MTVVSKRPRQTGARRRGAGSALAGSLLSSATAVAILMLILTALYRFATGMSPWPVFVLVEIPSATVAFALLVLTSPRSTP